MQCACEASPDAAGTPVPFILPVLENLTWCFRPEEVAKSVWLPLHVFRCIARNRSRCPFNAISLYVCSIS